MATALVRAVPGIGYLRRDQLIYELKIRGMSADGSVPELAARLRTATQIPVTLSPTLFSDHGDGVQNAFASTPRVMTLSLHHHGPGIYPCSGDVMDIGISNGRYYTVNVPLNEGVSDSTYCDIFQKVTEKVFAAYRPDALVVQCGADGLHGDPVGRAFNLTPEAFTTCAGLLLSRGLPTLFLGGGGYNLPNTARCWAALTAVIAGCKLPPEVPEHDLLEEYGPYFEFGIQPSYRKDCNTKEYVDSILQEITENLKHVELKEKSQNTEKI